MSLATDILKRAEKIAPPKPEKKPRAPGGVPADRKKPEKKARHKTTRQHKAPEHAHIPGVGFHPGNNGWVAYCYDGVRTIGIGVFKTQARAHIALRLYKYWRKRGMVDIPHKPSFRLYTNR